MFVSFCFWPDLFDVIFLYIFVLVFVHVMLPSSCLFYPIVGF